MADQRLDDQPGYRPGDPQQGKRVDIAAERLEDAADVRVLQAERDLDPEESERDVPQSGQGLARPPGHSLQTPCFTFSVFCRAGCQ